MSNETFVKIAKDKSYFNTHNLETGKSSIVPKCTLTDFIASIINLNLFYCC